MIPLACAGDNLTHMSKKRHRRIEPVNTVPFSPIDLVPADQRDRAVAARLEQGYFLWTEEKLGAFVRLRFLPTA
jgi:hypothetical protein